MTLTTIALHVEPGAAELVDRWLVTPLAIAEAHAAHVTALVFSTTASQVDAATGDAMLSAGGLTDAEQATSEHVRQACAARGVRVELRGRSSFAFGIGQNFADQMRVSDIGVMCFDVGAGLAQRFMASGGLFSSGRPLLLVPRNWGVAAHPSRIVLAWDATPAAVRAVHGALPLITRASAVTIVSVTDDKEFRPGQSGAELAHLLARHGANATFRPLQRGRGGVMRVMLDAAAEMQADMMVMGAVRHAPLHNLVFGSATMQVLDHGPTLPTLLAA